jgi:hypothetical protein
MTIQFSLVMSSVVETSLRRFLYSLRSAGMTTSVIMHIVPPKYYFKHRLDEVSMSSQNGNDSFDRLCMASDY